MNAESNKTTSELPPYVKTGYCKRCEASIYSPEVQPEEEVLPSMSACVCPDGPEIVLAPEAKNTQAAKRRGAAAGETAHAA